MLVCYYCGAPADTVDHTIPRHFLERIDDPRKAFPGIRHLEVPACRECNSTLSGQLFHTLSARRECIRKHLRKKYRSYLAIPHWTEEELAEVSPELASMVRAGLETQRWVVARVRYAGGKFHPYEHVNAPFTAVLAASKLPTGEDE